MKGVCIVVLGVLTIGAANETLEKNEFSGELQDFGLTSSLSKPTTAPLTTSAKQKRCNYNVKRSNPAPKISYERRRLETLCNFCKKSDLRMRTPLCKKCVENMSNISPSNTPFLLRSTLGYVNDQSNEEQKTDNFLAIDEADNSRRENLYTTHAILENFPNKFNHPYRDGREFSQIVQPGLEQHYYPATNNILGRLLPKATTSKTWGKFNTNWLKQSDIADFTLLQDPKAKTLENNNQLTYDDYLNILKEALKNEDNSYSTDIHKRNLSHKETKTIIKTEDRFKNGLLLNVLSKHILDISPESEENLSDIIGASITSIPTEITKITSKRKTQEITTEASLTNEPIINVQNNLGSRYYSRFNYNKQPREKLQLINNEWVVIQEPPKNIFPKIDSILKMISPKQSEEMSATKIVIPVADNSENNLTLSHQNSSPKNKIDTENSKESAVIVLNSIIKSNKNSPQEEVIKTKNSDHSTTENSIISSEKLDTNFMFPNPTNKTKILEDIRNQFSSSRYIYRKNPRFKSTYIGGTHKFVRENVTTPNWDISNNETSTERSNTTKSSEVTSEVTYMNDLIKLTHPTNNTQFVTKRISIRSTKESPTLTHNSSANKANNNEIIRKVLPTRHTLLHLLNKPTTDNNEQDIFHRHLNMSPNVNSDKYKNIFLSTKNNIEKQITTDNLDDANKNLNNFDSAFGHKNYRSKIYLPLILSHNDDGTIQLTLDKSEICTNCTFETEKNIFKRKIDDLTKHPMNEFNILESYNDGSSLNLNNYLQVARIENFNNELKERFYNYLIDEQILKLFRSLEIPVGSSAEIHSYIDDLKEDEKKNLNQYILDNISKEFATADNEFNEELFNREQNEFVKKMINLQNIETTATSNISPLNIKPNNAYQPNSLVRDRDSIRMLIQDEISKRFNYICPTCHENQCKCQNNAGQYYPIENHSNNRRIIDKRHYTHVPHNDINGHDTLSQKKYQIATNLLNWARDIVVKDKH